MQRRELDRNAGPLRQRRVAGARSDRRDRIGIGVEIFLGVGRGARALAQHVERIAEFAMRARPVERLLDGLAEHEMRAEEPHRLPRRRPHRRQAEPLCDAVEDRLRRLARMDDAGGDAERPGRGRDQKRVRLDLALEPVPGRELVLDQPVGGRGVGHAQQRLGQHHQRQALLGRERIGVEEILDAAEAAGLGADALDQPPRLPVDAVLGRAVARRLGDEAGRELLVGRRVGRPQRRQACLRRQPWPCDRPDRTRAAS